MGIMNIRNTSNLSMELPDTPGLSLETNRRSLDFPPEILVQVFSILAPSTNLYLQPTLHSCALVSRLWYSAAVQPLYDCPFISGANFNLFVNTICPSINSHVKTNGLADMVKRLDMSRLIHDGSKSLTARILRRCKNNLEEFVAPQASFAINSFAALSKCTNLRRLDLSYVAYTLDLDSFFNSIKNLDKLECLFYPHSRRLNNKKPAHAPSWPMNLRELHIPGSFSTDSLEFMSDFPSSLTHLGIRDFSPLIAPMVRLLLQKLGPQLESLEIQKSKIVPGEYSLDEVLHVLPVLRRLSIPAEHISAGFFTCAFELMSKEPSPLVELELNGSPSWEPPYFGSERANIDCNNVWDAVADGGLGRLRRLKVHRSLEWDLSREARHDLKALGELLQTLAREDAEASGSHEMIDAGVWIVDK